MFYLEIGDFKIRRVGSSVTLQKRRRGLRRATDAHLCPSEEDDMLLLIFLILFVAFALFSLKISVFYLLFVFWDEKCF